MAQIKRQLLDPYIQYDHKTGKSRLHINKHVHCPKCGFEHTIRIFLGNTPNENRYRGKAVLGTVIEHVGSGYIKTSRGIKIDYDSD